MAAVAWVEKTPPCTQPLRLENKNESWLTILKFAYEMKEWFGNHPTAMWYSVDDVLPQFNFQFL